MAPPTARPPAGKRQMSRAQAEQRLKDLMELCIDLELPTVVRNQVLLLPEAGKKYKSNEAVTDPAKRLLALKTYLDYQAEHGKDSILRKWTWADKKIADYKEDEPSDPKLAAFKSDVDADLKAVKSLFRKRNSGTVKKKKPDEKGGTQDSGKVEKPGEKGGTQDSDKKEKAGEKGSTSATGEKATYFLKVSDVPRDMADQRGRNWNRNEGVKQAARKFWEKVRDQVIRNYPYVPDEPFGDIGLTSKNDNALDPDTRAEIRVRGALLRVELATAFANWLRAFNLGSFLQSAIKVKKGEPKFMLMVAVPGLSRHGVGGAYDFAVHKEGSPTPIASHATGRMSWQQPSPITDPLEDGSRRGTWSEELNIAIKHSRKMGTTKGLFDPEHLGKDEKGNKVSSVPPEPWHYNYKHPYLGDKVVRPGRPGEKGKNEK